MNKPQQPELHRSGLGQTDPASIKTDLEVSERAPDGDEPMGPVPAENEAGHRPEHDQDKPDLDAFAERLGIRPGEEQG
jgi:hypothetical protein